MLILTRKPGESVYIGDSVKVTIVEIKGHQIRVGIEAPKELRIYREEIYLQILEENRQAAQAAMESDAGFDAISAKPTQLSKLGSGESRERKSSSLNVSVKKRKKPSDE
ncbi:MAG: carbon storage regulator [Candidatus Dadabacteria bacterium]|nr:MAG: carbon storage regulator [Candidatus Dadabacteria bacterium]